MWVDGDVVEKPMYRLSFMEQGLEEG